MGKSVTRLYTQFQPSKYGLALTPDPDAMTFVGTVMILGKKVGRPSKRITLHQKGLKITAATIVKNDKKGGAQSVEIERINNQDSFDEVRLHTKETLYAGEYTVTLTFQGSIHEVMHGIYPCNYEIDGKKQKLIATQFESHHAREAFPCIDEPEAKATFDLTLITPKDQTAISNTPAKEWREAGDMLVTTFETTPKMSTYLLAFVFGDMQYKEATTKDGVVIRVWATRAQNKAALDFPLEVGVRAVEFFNDYYGVPYPLAKCDHVALPDFSSAAMENWGLITYREGYLLVDPVTTVQSMRETITTVICHELSHQWFGNLVTMKWWDDLWLNESFANVMEYVATDALFPEWHIWDTFITHESLAAFRRDSLAGVQSVKTAVNHPDEISTLFDPSIVYAKGGRLLNMLMNYLGSDDFRKGLKIYFGKHAYGNTTGNDLWQALSEASGKDVASFMNPWLTRSGFPLVRVSQKAEKLELTQTHFLLDPTKADIERIWPVPTLTDNTAVEQLLTSAELTVSLPKSDYIRINVGAVGHYLVQYTEPAHALAIAKLVSTQQLTSAERLMLLNDSSLTARAGYESFAASLRLLEHYANEDSEPVWDMIAVLIGDSRRFIDLDPELEAPIKAFVGSLITKQFKRLGWDEIDGESGADVKLRGTIIALGVYAENKEILDHALRAFSDYQKDESAVSSELRSIVFGAAVRHEVAGATEYLLTLEAATNNPDLKQEILGALTSTKSPEFAAELLERVKDSTKVRLHDVDIWVVSLLRNRYTRTIAWQWLRDNWSWVEEVFAGDKSYDNFPRYAAGAFNTKPLFEEYKAFFEPKKANVSLTRNITLGIEELSSRISWLERDIAAVQTFFQARK
jgi:aminopeptidase N